MRERIHIAGGALSELEEPILVCEDEEDCVRERVCVHSSVCVIVCAGGEGMVSLTS